MTETNMRPEIVGDSSRPAVLGLPAVNTHKFSIITTRTAPESELVIEGERRTFLPRKNVGFEKQSW
jgi:hypothetical protein